jgi:hypothetical protein
MLFGSPLSKYKPKYPINLTHRKRVKKSYTKSEAQIIAPQYLRIVQDCTNLVNNTLKPDVFFNRYDLMISCLVELEKMEKVMKFSGKKPSKYLKEVLTSRDKQIELFVDRIFNFYRSKILSAKTSKSKSTSCVRFDDTMEDISCEFSKSLALKAQMLSDNLKSMC